jgi:hypothetical protein
VSKDDQSTAENAGAKARADFTSAWMPALAIDGGLHIFLRQHLDAL